MKNLNWALGEPLGDAIIHIVDMKIKMACSDVRNAKSKEVGTDDKAPRL